MRKISKSQTQKNAKLAEIKKGMDKRCFFCGMHGYDLCHILSRSLFPQYYYITRLSKKYNLKTLAG